MPVRSRTRTTIASRQRRWPANDRLNDRTPGGGGHVEERPAHEVRRGGWLPHDVVDDDVRGNANGEHRDDGEAEVSSHDERKEQNDEQGAPGPVEHVPAPRDVGEGSDRLGREDELDAGEVGDDRAGHARDDERRDDPPVSPGGDDGDTHASEDVAEAVGHGDHFPKV